MSKLTSTLYKAKRMQGKDLTRQLERAANQTAYVASLGKRLSKGEWLARQLWGVVAHGRLQLTDGTELKVDSFDEWLAAARFITSRIEGTPTQHIQQDGTSILKAYIGVSPDDWDDDPVGAEPADEESDAST